MLLRKAACGGKEERALNLHRASPFSRPHQGRFAPRAQHDAAFRAALIEEVIQAYLDGDVDDARSMLRDCINATIGFAKLSVVTKNRTKRLMRMVGPNGNPSASNLMSVLQAVQQDAGVKAQVAVDGVDAETAEAA